MSRRLRDRFAESGRALRDVYGNRSLRRLQLAQAVTEVSGWAYAMAIAVYAFDVGGAALVGLAALSRTLPAAIVAPLAGVLADRYPRERVMAISNLTTALALAVAAAAVAADAPAAVVLAPSVIVALSLTAFAPAHGALLPSLTHRPEELTAANVVSSTIESLGLFIGPGLGGLLLALTGTDVVFATAAGAYLWSALLVSRIRHDVSGERDAVETESKVLRAALAGFRIVVEDARLRLLVGLFAAQTLVDGVLNVLLVITALELLSMGEAGVGILNSAVGVGALLGAVAAFGLAGRPRLAAAFGAGIFLWGLPIALIGAWPEQAAVLVLLAVVGVGNTLVDVSGYTLLQRAVPDEVLGRVFATLESLIIATLALGSIVAPLLIDGLGIRLALAATGAFLPLIAMISWRHLTAIDAAVEAPFASSPSCEGCHSSRRFPRLLWSIWRRVSTPVRLASGEEVVRQGEPGERFYVIAQGELEVLVDGEVVRTQGPGEHFGEIALLRDVPRTATVHARGDVLLYALERDDFIGAVTGHPPSLEAADAVVATRLSRARPGLASL